MISAVEKKYGWRIVSGDDTVILNKVIRESIKKLFTNLLIFQPIYFIDIHIYIKTLVTQNSNQEI